MTTGDARRSLRVGLFLAAGAALVLAVLVVIGNTQRPFARKVHLRTAFGDTAGLTVGAPVRLGGVDVGTVQEITFPTELAIKDISVLLSIQARYLPRIRADSRAMLTPKGLLGDLTVTITIGSASEPPLDDGAFIPAADSQTIGEVVGSLQNGLDEIRSLSRGLRGRLDSFLTPDVARDFARFVRAAADDAEAIKNGDGLAHTLIYDPTIAADARLLAKNASRGATDVAAAMARIDRIAQAIETGDGAAHRLVYADDLGPIVADAQRAVSELAEATAAIRDGNGPLHALVYGAQGDELLRNLTALSRQLKMVGDDLAAGKGTLGALLRDPSIYEDLKLVLRNVKRNTLLKALVRFTIQRDHLRDDGSPVAR